MRNSSGRETTSLYDNFPVTALYSQFVIQHFLCVVSLALDRLLKMADDDDFGPDGGFSFGEEPDFGPDPGEMDFAFADDLFDPLPEEDPFASQIEGPDGAAGAAPPGAAKASAKYPGQDLSDECHQHFVVRRVREGVRRPALGSTAGAQWTPGSSAAGISLGRNRAFGEVEPHFLWKVEGLAVRLRAAFR